MYDARGNVKKIVLLLITLEDKLEEIGILRNNTTKVLNKNELAKLKECLWLLNNIQRELNIFSQEHKIFKERFVFNGSD